ncbi:class I adenylate-forming enzyme family protein [Streptomyces europaeiscabiei]|uniref:Class I adenylate-forming enzyme family protein n=2 Tax=Streptomyces europaeiscabiei TaxID=146819 RepID=A0ABU4NUN7_9ACTN|nr:class I adenylate-forming enzyme family protein [Streptomyces europaeiscabiei]MDX3550078.1 class I adenylate-forming enzyme family protein [Streptomyces europaeiscabiei]MDX3559299.1 class I adenylate-forming enzyme family protein [Streptomyces europaeiscabiei]MDX3706735.1 class I adenylate-forming enzyme family protein [Streptomyces europaeiscabiei]MDX3839838.1 class I adenylate-forming enzyme family protein [Streptomyces europaeiscabiei]
MIKLDDIRRHAAVRPDADAVVDGATRLSWARFADAVDRFAAGLVTALPDVRPVRAVFLAGPRWELTVAMAACATLGIPCTGLDPQQEPDRLRAALELLGPCAVFVAPEYQPQLERCAWPGADRALRVVLDGESGPLAGQAAGAPRTRSAFPVLLGSEPLQQLPSPLHREWLTVVPGGPRPRVAVRAAAAEARALIDLVEEFGFDAHDIHLVAAPLWQPLALQLTRTLLAVGATVVLGALRDPAALAAQLTCEGVTTAVLDPGVLLALLAHPACDAPAHTPQLRCVVTPGTHLGRWTLDAAWERLGPVLHLVHSTPESGLVTILTPEESQVARARSGRAGLGTTVVVLDDTGAVLPAGRPGRIAVTGHQVMDGYLDGEDAFVTLDAGAGQQRFLVTDDLGLLDEQGRLVLTGRGSGVTAVARDGAMDAALFRLESDLLNLPCLRDTAVVRVDLPALGGEALVVPFIAVAVGREVTGHTALRTACARRVPSIPAHVIAVDAIPYSPTGRIRTAELLEAVVPIITLNLQLEQTVHQEISA